MKALLLSVAIAVTIAGCATTTSPTGRRQYVGAVSQAELNQLGAEAFAELKQQEPLTNNAQQRAYVTCVVGDLVQALPADWRQATGETGGWETAVFQNADANAFALPGGKVGVYTGIFDVARNQDQLAAVIAHEIGHVVAHHHDERITGMDLHAPGSGEPDQRIARSRQRARAGVRTGQGVRTTPELRLTGSRPRGPRGCAAPCFSDSVSGSFRPSRDVADGIRLIRGPQ